MVKELALRCFANKSSPLLLLLLHSTVSLPDNDTRKNWSYANVTVADDSRRKTRAQRQQHDEIDVSSSDTEVSIFIHSAVQLNVVKCNLWPKAANFWNLPDRRFTGK